MDILKTGKQKLKGVWCDTGLIKTLEVVAAMENEGHSVARLIREGMELRILESDYRDEAIAKAHEPDPVEKEIRKPGANFLVRYRLKKGIDP